MPGREIKGTSKIANYRHGGRAGYRSGTLVGKNKSMGGLPTPIRLSLVEQAKARLKKGKK